MRARTCTAPPPLQLSLSQHRASTGRHPPMRPTQTCEDDAVQQRRGRAASKSFRREQRRPAPSKSKSDRPAMMPFRRGPTSPGAPSTTVSASVVSPPAPAPSVVLTAILAASCVGRGGEAWSARQRVDAAASQGGQTAGAGAERGRHRSPRMRHTCCQFRLLTSSSSSSRVDSPACSRRSSRLSQG